MRGDLTLLSFAGFLLDPRRLAVALSRAKRKMVLVASRSIFSLFSPDEEVFANSLLWKNLLLRTYTALLWERERAGKRVAVRKREGLLLRVDCHHRLPRRSRSRNSQKKTVFVGG
jgi:hypothetical protein